MGRNCCLFITKYKQNKTKQNMQAVLSEMFSLNLKQVAHIGQVSKGL
jgi:hypothetical protein